MRFILIGAPGSGKSVVSRELSKSLHIPIISIGQRIRELAESGTGPQADAAREALKKGELVPDEMAVEILRDRLKEEDAQRGFLIDGMPRTLNEARMMDGMFALNKVFHLKVEPSTAFQRLLRRGRSDDQPHLIQRRLDLHHEEIPGILNFYRSRGVLVEADASSSIQDAAREVMSKLQ